jgi:rubrerythrin
MDIEDSLKTKSVKARGTQWCPECKKYVLAVRPKTNFMLNMLLSVVTMGLWFLIWACTADLGTKQPKQCPVCGTTTQERADSDAVDGLDSHTTKDNKHCER